MSIQIWIWRYFEADLDRDLTLLFRVDPDLGLALLFDANSDLDPAL
jgi:hypothetical protein